MKTLHGNTIPINDLVKEDDNVTIGDYLELMRELHSIAEAANKITFNQIIAQRKKRQNGPKNKIALSVLQ